MLLDDVPTDVLYEATFRAIAKLGNATNADVESEVANELQLSVEDRAARIPSGTKTTLGYRICWGRTALQTAGRIVRTSRGVWRVAEPGETPPEPSTSVTTPVSPPVAAAPPLIPWRRLTVRELLLAQRQTLRELRRRKIVRGKGAVIGDLAEWLVAEAYDGTLAPPSQKAHDVDLADGTRIQVKARVLSVEGGAGDFQLGAIRHQGYDLLIAMLFDDEDLGVLEAIEIPRELLERRGVEKNGAFTLYMNPTIIGRLLEDGAVRITERLRSVAEGLHDPPGELTPDFGDADGGDPTDA